MWPVRKLKMDPSKTQAIHRHLILERTDGNTISDGNDKQTPHISTSYFEEIQTEINIMEQTEDLEYEFSEFMQQDFNVKIVKTG